MLIITALLVLVADQLSKIYIMHTMALGQSIPVISGIFHITYVLNPGAAFGLLENQRWFFVLIAVAMVVAVIYYYRRLRKQPWLFRYGAMVLVGGAIGNLIDRVQTGLVVDFLDFRIWPVFNVADIFIVGGVAAMVLAMVLQDGE